MGRLFVVTDLTPERAQELLNYDEASGHLTWRRSKGAAKAGGIAGCTSKTQWGAYIAIRIDGRLYLAHRVIWLLKTGKWPAIFIDHADRNGLNNAWSNLREATASQNNANRKTTRKVQSAPRGVWFDKRFNAYYARGYFNKKYLHLGTFKTAEEAAQAYARWAQNTFEDFAYKETGS